jgi:hypothetical protein
MDFQLDTCISIVPAKLLLYTPNEVRAVQAPMEDGSDPVNWFMGTLKKVRPVQAPIENGSGPFNLFLGALKKTRLVHKPTSGGMGPSKPRLFMLTLDTRLPTHLSMPVHVHSLPLLNHDVSRPFPVLKINDK